MAEYVAMVAAVTGLSKHDIEMNLPLAQGLQFQAIWLEMQGNDVGSLHAPSDISHQWHQIAGT